MSPSKKVAGYADARAVWGGRAGIEVISPQGGESGAIEIVAQHRCTGTANGTAWVLPGFEARPVTVRRFIWFGRSVVSP